MNPETQSDTPLSDGALLGQFNNPFLQYVNIDFARSLERALTESRKAYADALELLKQKTEERHELQNLLFAAEGDNLNQVVRIIIEQRDAMNIPLDALDSLRAALKECAVALDNGLLNLRHVVSALHATNTISPDARMAINEMKQALSNSIVQQILNEKV